jgi:hypothetical protein
MMTKDELHTLAAAGVAGRVGEIEKELASYHREWPELFLSPTVPQLLKAPVKTNGHDPRWAALASQAAPTTGHGLVDARTAGAQARRLKGRIKEMHAAARGHAKRQLSPNTREAVGLDEGAPCERRDRQGAEARRAEEDEWPRLRRRRRRRHARNGMPRVGTGRCSRTRATK